MNTPTPTNQPDPAPGEMPTAASILGATSMTKADLLRIQALLVQAQALVARMNFTAEEARRDTALGGWQRNHGAVLRATEEQYVAVKAEMNRLLEPRFAPVQPPISHQIESAARCHPEVWAQIHGALISPDKHTYPSPPESAFVTPPVETISPLPPGAVLVRKPKTALDLLRDELNRTRITSENIGEIRAKYIDDDDSEWNAAVRDWTAERENKPPLAEPAGALKAILAAAEALHCETCFSLFGTEFCGEDEDSHGLGHPFVSLATLLGSVAELASAQAAESIAELKRQHQEEMNSLRGQLATISNTRRAANARALKYEAERDALLEMTWLDGPGEPHETIDQLKAQFAAGWVRKTQLDEAEKTIAAQHRLMASAEQRGAEKGRAESAPAESYRLLEMGEIIQEGDQWQDGQGQWRKSNRGIGKQVCGADCIRRPITGGAGLHEAATVSQAPATASSDEAQ